MEEQNNKMPADFETLYKSYFTPVYRYIFLRVRNKEEAEDMAQDVFVKAYDSLEHFHSQEDKSPLCYFFIIARNTLIDYWRKRPKRSVSLPTGQAEEVPDLKQNTKENFEKKEFLEAVKEGLDKMSDEQAEIIILKFIKELSNKEISELTGKKEESIRQTQHRALEKLREYLNKNGHEY
jgi:RNA polymerase sigma-70 factor (ECF subfamily)